jgi:predicted metal-binding membrane protein
MGARLSLLCSRQPHWWIAVAVGGAWLALLAGPLAGLAAGSPAGLPAAGHGHHGSMLADLAGWALMAFAMTVPVTLPAVRHVAHNSIRSRRQWAMTLYLAAYLAVWVAFGFAVLAAIRLAPLHKLDGRVLLIAVLMVAAVWQLTRTKRRALLACRRTVSLPPRGSRADAACVRFGLRQARRCVVSCWPLMLLMVVLPASAVWMVVLAFVMYAEERTRIGRRMVRPLAGLLAAAATAVAVFG